MRGIKRVFGAGRKGVGEALGVGGPSSGAPGVASGPPPDAQAPDTPVSGEQPGAEREQLQHILDAMSDAVVVLEEGGRVTTANPATEHVLGVAPEELVGSSLRKRLSSAGLERLIAEAAKNDIEIEDEVELMWPVRRRLQVRVAPWAGAPGAVVAVITDVSRPRRVEHMRRDFVANVSHELKTPVAGLSLLAESLQAALDAGDQDTARHFAERLVADAEHLSDLTTDLLTLSRIESQGAAVSERVDLAGIVTAVADRAARHAERKGVTVRTDIAPHLPAVPGGRDDYACLVQNLVENAIRYTDAGSVTVSLAPSAAGVVLEVKDTGVGIPARDLSRVFERFYRVERSRARHTGGTGLGLSIVRNIADAYGLTVELSSIEDSGTTARVTFPAAQAGAAG